MDWIIHINFLKGIQIKMMLSQKTDRQFWEKKEDLPIIPHDHSSKWNCHRDPMKELRFSLASTGFPVTSLTATQALTLRRHGSFHSWS